MARIGVFICWCGTNISGTVNVEEVMAAASSYPGVAHVADYRYLCSEMGQDLIIKAIKENDLQQVVVGTCSPRMHEKTFRQVMERGGLNPYMLQIANLREHCSWVHRDPAEATAKAKGLIRSAVAKVALSTPLTALDHEVEKRALVIGGGIAGIQAALDIADSGYLVDLVEKEPSIGGRMAQLEKTFPTLDCSACILTPKMVEAAQHPNIELITYSEVEEVGGFVGQFEVTIKKKARSVDASKCNGCGNCWEKCPVKVPSEFNMGMDKRRAIYVPFPQAVPNIPVIDREHCRFFGEGKCKVCEKKCDAGAIDFTQEDERITRRYGAIVVATGFDVLNPVAYGEYGYGQYPDVLTAMEFERLLVASGPTGGKILRPSNGQVPRSVVFIQCVGSRDKARGQNYCSRICCMYTAKHAVLMKEKEPGITAYIFYIDLRTAGKGYEEFQRRTAEEFDAVYIRGSVGKVFPENNSLIVKGVDSLSGKPLEIEADMVVLATASIPRAGSSELARVLNINTDSYNFFNEAHPKLKPVETQTAGIFIAGACQAPKDIPDTVAQAGAAAAKAVNLLSKERLTGEACVAESEPARCIGCLFCVDTCPYKAITPLPRDSAAVGGKVGLSQDIVEVNSALCQGCGSCVVACRTGAMDLHGFTDNQILAEVDALCSY